LDIKKALIIDDEDALREIISEVLAMQDIRTIQAANGNEAIRLAAEHKEDIDLLIIDMFMPVMSGEETYKQISEILPDCKVIFMSGYNSDQSFSDTDFGSNQRILKKPFTITGLKDMITDMSDA
jgi:CheY-like chemotaxis protein